MEFNILNYLTKCERSPIPLGCDKRLRGKIQKKLTIVSINGRLYTRAMMVTSWSEAMVTM